jgi:hypothetical protein
MTRLALKTPRIAAMGKRDCGQGCRALCLRQVFELSSDCSSLSAVMPGLAPRLSN